MTIARPRIWERNATAPTTKLGKCKKCKKLALLYKVGTDTNFEYVCKTCK